jgi:hypothetical protein
MVFLVVLYENVRVVCLFQQLLVVVLVSAYFAFEVVVLVGDLQANTPFGL